MATTAELGTAPLPPADDTPAVETPTVLPGVHLEAEVGAPLHFAGVRDADCGRLILRTMLLTPTLHMTL